MRHAPHRAPSRHIAPHRATLHHIAPHRDHQSRVMHPFQHFSILATHQLRDIQINSPYQFITNIIDICHLL